MVVESVSSVKQKYTECVESGASGFQILFDYIESIFLSDEDKELVLEDPSDMTDVGFAHSVLISSSSRIF